MRISDWSSDVCSSDLHVVNHRCAENDATGLQAQQAHAGQHARGDADAGRDHRRTEKQRLDLAVARSEEHTSELQSLMRISYAVFCLKKKTQQHERTKWTQ